MNTSQMIASILPGRKTAFKLSLLSILLASIQCSKREESIDVSKSVNVAAFHTINIDGECDVTLVQDTFYGITFTGYDKYVNASSASVSDSVLTIETSHKGEMWHPSRSNTTVFIHFNSIKLINANESCHLHTSTPLTGGEIGFVSTSKMIVADLELNCHVFYFWNYPNGTHMNLKGQVDELKLWCTGLSSIDARDVITPYVLVENGAQGDIHVRSSQTLDYSLTNIGNIYYYGNPAEIKASKLTGEGKLINAQ